MTCKLLSNEGWVNLDKVSRFSEPFTRTTDSVRAVAVYVDNAPVGSISLDDFNIYMNTEAARAAGGLTGVKSIT